MEIQKYYQDESKTNGVCARNNLPKIKDRTYVINLDGFKSIGTHSIALYVNTENATYFDSSGVEHITKEIKKTRRKQKYHNKYLYNTSIWFDNVCRLFLSDLLILR